MIDLASCDKEKSKEALRDLLAVDRRKLEKGYVIDILLGNCHSRNALYAVAYEKLGLTNLAKKDRDMQSRLEAQSKRK